MGRSVHVVAIWIMATMWAMAQAYTVDPVDVRLSASRLDTTVTQRIRVRNNSGVGVWATIRLRDGRPGYSIAPSGQVWLTPNLWSAIDLSVTPQSYGTSSDQLQVIVNSAIEGTCAIQVVVQQSKARIDVTPPTLSFGDVPIGTTKTLRLTVALTGRPSADVVLSRIDARDMIPRQGPDVRLSSSSSTVVDVDFTPLEVGAQSGTLVLSHADTIVRIAMSGTGTTPSLPRPVVDKDSLALDADVGGNDKNIVTLRNAGTAPLRGTASMLDGRVMSVNVASFTLPPNGSQQFEVTFTPTDDLDIDDAIRFEFDNVAGITIPCRGTARIIPAFDVSPNVVDLGRGQIGETLTSDVRIENRSRRQLQLTLQFRDGTSFALPDGPDVTIDPLDVVRVPLSCSSDQAAALVDQLIITDGTSEVGVQCLALIVDESAIITAEPDRVDFDEVDIGLTTSSALILQNSGQRAAELTLRVDPSDDALFSIDRSSLVLTPGERDTIIVAFNALRTGAHEATIFIAVDGSEQLQVATSAFVRRPTIVVAGGLQDHRAAVGDTTSTDLVVIVADTLAMTEISSVAVTLEANVQIIAPVVEVVADSIGDALRIWSIELPWPGGAPGDSVKLQIPFMVALGDAVDATLRIRQFSLNDANSSPLPINSTMDSTALVSITDIWFGGGTPRLVTGPRSTFVRSIAPHPLDDHATIQLNGVEGAVVQCVLYDVTGRDVRRWRMHVDQGGIRIDCADVDQGSYMLRVIMTDASTTIPVVKR